MGASLLGIGSRAVKYFQMKPYGELERVEGQPVVEAPRCGTCGRAKGRGDSSLVVRFTDPEPHPDALGVLFGPEWAASPRMRSVIDAVMDQPPRYEPILSEDGKALVHQQVLLAAALRVGRESIRGGEACEECGGYVQLSLEPLFLRRPVGGEPVLAYLLESPAVILVREDLARALEAAKLDVELAPVLFEGEKEPATTLPTFDKGSDWSDLKRS